MNNVRRTQYPKLTVDTRKLYNNIKTVVDDCSSQGISIAGVIKGFNGIYEAALQFVKAGCSQLATSRMEQIIDAREKGIDAEFMLVRIPMLSEAEEVAAYADMSLNSEIEVIRAIDRACEKFGRTHGIILMADLGDLREGYWDKDELVETAVYIENELKNVKLTGVGTNLGCYGSIKPTVDKMNELADIACRIEEKIGRELDIVAESVGGGRIRICKIDGLDANFSGDYPTLIVHNLDQPGHVTEVTSMLGHKSINIATMQLYRACPGGHAVMVLECDQEVPKESLKWLEHLEGILKVTYLSLKE